MTDPLINYEAEAELLGSMMASNGLIDRVADLVTPDDFMEPVHSRIYSALLREAMNGKAANPVTIRGYFEGDESLTPLGGPVYLMKLAANCMGIGTIDIAKQLAELSKRRLMRAGLATAAQACADLEATTAEIIAHADGALSGNAQDSIHQPTGGECIDELLASFKEGHSGVTSTIQSLDDLLGPVRAKQLIVVAGRPGMGKTALALSYALGAAQQGHGVLFASLEMAAPELGARMLADLCFDANPVPYNFIRDGDLQGRQCEAVIKAQAQAHSLPFQVADTGSLNIGRLNMLIRRHQRRMEAHGEKLELVVVDYLQLLHPDSKGRSQYESVTEVSKALKAMAKDNGVAIMALAQLSRSVEGRPDKRPMLSDLRDSGQIEQDADAVLFLLRAEYYVKQEEPDAASPDHPAWAEKMENAKGVIEFILAKRRNGETGSAFGQFHGAYQAVRG